jgi:PIN domain nuclease of toxin-antitoxin system
VGRYFFDSSALAKLYQPEAGSDRVEAIFRQPQRRLIISRLTAVEMHSDGYVEPDRCGCSEKSLFE